MKQVQDKKRMSAKLFARWKYSNEEKAFDYIQNHLAWLKTHSFLTPLVEAFEAKDIDSVSALYAFQEALLSHHYTCALLTAEKSIEENRNAIKSNKLNDAYIITIFCMMGGGIDIGKRKVKRSSQDPDTGKISYWEEEEDMIYGKSLYQDAHRKACRMLVDQHHSLFAEIVNTIGDEVKSTIFRSEAFAELYSKNRTPVVRNLGKKEAPLKNYATAHNDKARGPWENFRTQPLGKL